MKRTLVTLVLTLTFLVSATAFAVLPAHQSAPAPTDGTSIAMLSDIGMPFVLAGDECPGAGDTGCGG